MACWKGKRLLPNILTLTCVLKNLTGNTHVSKFIWHTSIIHQFITYAFYFQGRTMNCIFFWPFTKPIMTLIRFKNRKLPANFLSVNLLNEIFNLLIINNSDYIINVYINMFHLTKKLVLLLVGHSYNSK
jgi:hypothetical protein